MSTIPSEARSGSALRAARWRAAAGDAVPRNPAPKQPASGREPVAAGAPPSEGGTPERAPVPRDARHGGLLWPAATLGSVAFHLALALMLLSAPAPDPSQVPRGGEEMPTIEFLVVGTEQSLASEAGARPAEPLPEVEMAPPEQPAIDAALLPPADPPVDPVEPPVTEATPVSPVPTARQAVVEPQAPPIELPPIEPPPLDLTLPAEIRTPATASPAPAEPPAMPPQPERPRTVARARATPKAAVSESRRQTVPARRATEAGRGESGRGEAAATRSASSAGGSGGRETSAGASEIASYRARVQAHLARYKHYPDELRERGIRGRAVIRFTLSRAGRISGAMLAGSSGAPGLDQATLSMVHRAEPFPAMPDGGPASMTFAIPVNYDVR